MGPGWTHSSPRMWMGYWRGEACLPRCLDHETREKADSLLPSLHTITQTSNEVTEETADWSLHCRSHADLVGCAWCRHTSSSSLAPAWHALTKGLTHTSALVQYQAGHLLPGRVSWLCSAWVSEVVLQGLSSTRVGGSSRDHMQRICTARSSTHVH